MLARASVLARSCATALFGGFPQLLQLLGHIHPGPVLGGHGPLPGAVPPVHLVPLLRPEVVVVAPPDGAALAPLHRDREPGHGALELVPRARPAAGLQRLV